MLLLESKTRAIDSPNFLFLEILAFLRPAFFGGRELIHSVFTEKKIFFKPLWFFHRKHYDRHNRTIDLILLKVTRNIFLNVLFLYFSVYLMTQTFKRIRNLSFKLHCSTELSPDSLGTSSTHFRVTRKYAILVEVIVDIATAITKASVIVMTAKITIRTVVIMLIQMQITGNLGKTHSENCR